MDIKKHMLALGQAARNAARELAAAPASCRQAAIAAMAEKLRAAHDEVMTANQQDVREAEKQGADAAFCKRLQITEKLFAYMVERLEQAASLPDPLGIVLEGHVEPSGLHVSRVSVPLGVVGIIYEARPNVTTDAAAVALKSGNAVILRGGAEAWRTNAVLVGLMQAAVTEHGLPLAAVQMPDSTDRQVVRELLRLERFVDVIIPRGGKSLIARISEHARVPVIKHLDGICHVYIDDEADKNKAIKVALNAKTHRYGVCNAMETLLIAQSRASEILPELAKLYQEKGVELRGCEKTCALIDAKRATEEDWQTEYLAPILSIRVVQGMEQAMEHIAQYSSAHTESIITENYSKARQFLAQVDSSSVMVNASTRFADGFEYGLGAEIGISTDKFHARGPVGLEGLTSQKYIVLGDGHIRQ